MKKIVIISIGTLLLILLGLFAFQRYYFNEEKIRERQVETWNERVNEFKNSKSGKIDLTNNIYLIWRIKDFSSENHKIEYCENQDAKYICKIDDNDWYGSDFKMDLPKNELKSLTIYIDEKYIKLDVSQMFNPSNGEELDKNHFKIKKEKDFYILYGYFSDGAGTYTTSWKIKDGKSFRRKISSNEEDFKWQNEK
ncbi:hypothetical protein [Epilithonimonas sp.]|uniref:hypothetical protein n=1 Tax=Epilithonimonas sp. TaxID=2894511 RepID=UPI002FDC9929